VGTAALASLPRPGQVGTDGLANSTAVPSAWEPTLSTDLLPEEIRRLYEVHEWKHACAVLEGDFAVEWADLIAVLSTFRLRRSYVLAPGGGKSPLAQALDSEFAARGWAEKAFDTSVVVDGQPQESPTHAVDCFKNPVAVEIEWNNKDPFYDRDLNNFRLLFELRAISVGVIITRTDELQGLFDELLGKGTARKRFGGATTHMGKLLPRVRGGGGRGLPPSGLRHPEGPVCGGLTMEPDYHPEVALSAGAGLLALAGKQRFGTVLADPPWRFQNRTGKVAPEHWRLSRYPTMRIEDILALPVAELALPRSHLYLWVPNALVHWGLEVMASWGFKYKTNIVWFKTRKDGGPDRRGVGFYFRNVTELILFGVRGSLRTLPPGRRQPNIVRSRKREHSRKPDELFEIIEACSPEPYVELFARGRREGWASWGNEVPEATQLPLTTATDRLTPPRPDSPIPQPLALPLQLQD